MVIANIADSYPVACYDGGGCSAAVYGCGNLNDTYVLNRTSACGYTYALSADICQFDVITLSIFYTAPDWFIAVRLGQNYPSVYNIYFTKTYDSAPDCGNLVDESIPFDWEFYQVCACDATSATCLITAT